MNAEQPTRHSLKSDKPQDESVKNITVEKPQMPSYYDCFKTGGTIDFYENRKVGMDYYVEFAFAKYPKRIFEILIPERLLFKFIHDRGLRQCFCPETGRVICTVPLADYVDNWAQLCYATASYIRSGHPFTVESDSTEGYLQYGIDQINWSKHNNLYK